MDDKSVKLLPSASAADEALLRPLPKPVPWYSCLLYPVYALLGLVGGGLYVVFLFLFLSLWFVSTVTCIGPLIERCFRKRDEAAYLDRRTITTKDANITYLEVPAGISQASGGRLYSVLLRVTRPPPGSPRPAGADTAAPLPPLPPLLLVNGLASNAFALFRAQDLFTSMGFTTVIYDRLGVGLSDHSPAGTPASAVDAAREMDYVMTHVEGIPPNDQWIAVGYSMGHAVTLAFMALFPNRLCGYVNNDGIPIGFVSLSRVFLETYAPIYKLYGRLVWTGFMRLMLNMPPVRSFLHKTFACQGFPIDFMLAQMASARYWSGVHLEFFTMISCCELASAAVGPASALRMDVDTLSRVCRVRPAATIRVDEAQGLERRVCNDERAPCELGDCYLTEAETLALLSSLQTRIEGCRELGVDAKAVFADSDRGKPAVGALAGGAAETDVFFPLGPQLARMSVRGLQAKAYPGGDSYLSTRLLYTFEMRNLAQVDHVVCTALAGRGARSVYLGLDHGGLCPAQPREVLRHVLEVAADVRGGLAAAAAAAERV